MDSPPPRIAVTHRDTSGLVAGNRNGSTMATYPLEELNSARCAKSIGSTPFVMAPGCVVDLAVAALAGLEDVHIDPELRKLRRFRDALLRPRACHACLPESGGV